MSGLYDWCFVPWRRRAIAHRIAEEGFRGLIRMFVEENRVEHVYRRIMWLLIGLMVVFCLAGIGGVAWLLNYG